MIDVSIRHEKPEEYREVENLTREAFWNLHTPGCEEHFLVHRMRNHRDFIPQLDFVALVDGKIVGNIMYTKSFVRRRDGDRFPTITFGPISVLPEYQRKGIGSSLITHSTKEAMNLGYKAIIILGSPYDYCKHGFRSSRDYNISDASDVYPLGQLVMELEIGALDGVSGRCIYSDVYNLDPDEIREFDKLFSPKKKAYRYSQEIFNILVRARLP